MTDIRQLGLANAVVRLRGTGERGRGFLGLDPVTQNDALLKRFMTELGAQLFAAGDAVLGYAPNPDNTRQAYVATTSEDPAVLAAFAEYLRIYRRCTSLVCHSVGDQPTVQALVSCGFQQVGVLRRHVYRGGAYHDVHVYYARGDLRCAP